jgi:iron complex outermembrane receptor protein
VRLSIPTWTNECVQVIGLIAPGVPQYGPATNCSGSESFGKFTWRANAQYEIGDRKMIYGSFSRGFRSGGFNGRAASPTSLGPYNPEIVDAYEFGLKADWLDRTLRTNLAFFLTDYNDKQEEVVQPSPPGSANPQETVVRNAATARIKGFEAEFVIQPVEELSISGSLSVIDASYRRFFRDVTGDLIPDDVSTLNLRRAPDVTWSVGLDYNRELGSGTLGLNTNFRYTDKYATCIIADPIALRSGVVTNDRRCTAQDRSILDATLSYTLPIGGTEMKLSVFGRNLLDNRGVSSTLPVAGLFTFAGARPPRQLGGEIQIKF